MKRRTQKLFDDQIDRSILQKQILCLNKTWEIMMKITVLQVARKGKMHT